MVTFPRYWPFVQGIHRPPVNSAHKGQWRGALMFSLICVSINGWVSNGGAGDLRRYRDHYDVIVMNWIKIERSAATKLHKVFDLMNTLSKSIGVQLQLMMTLWQGHIYRITDPLWDEFTRTKCQWCRAPMQFNVCSMGGLLHNNRMAIAMRRLTVTHWGRDKMDAISQTTFSSAFSWIKLFEFRLKFHWTLFWGSN